MAAIQALGHSVVPQAGREESKSGAAIEAIQRGSLPLAIAAGGSLLGWLLASVPHSAVVIAALMLCAGLGAVAIRSTFQRSHRDASPHNTAPVLNVAFAASRPNLHHAQARPSPPSSFDNHLLRDYSPESRESYRRFYLM